MAPSPSSPQDRQLDPALFDVTGLIEQGYDGARTPRLPLIVEYGQSVRASAPRAPEHSTYQAALDSVRGGAGRRTALGDDRRRARAARVPRRPRGDRLADYRATVIQTPGAVGGGAGRGRRRRRTEHGGRPHRRHRHARPRHRSGHGGRALTLLPDHHLCVIREEQIAGDVPEALALLDPMAPSSRTGSRGCPGRAPRT